MARVAVRRAVLEWALQRSGRTVEVREKFPELSRWLSGAIQPTLPQLESLAKATATPIGYFFLEAPPEDKLPIPHFRTARDRPLHRASANLLETVQAMQRRQDWMREQLVEEDAQPLTFVRSIRTSFDAAPIAADIRRALKLVKGWARVQPSWTQALRELFSRTETAGILVVVNGVVGNNTHRKLDPNEFRGFVLVDEYAPLVFVNGADFKAAQMFTLAHELAHIWLGSSAAFDLRNLEPAPVASEQACNKIAAEFLVPEEELREAWPIIRVRPEPFQDAARYFKVSALVAARRAQDLRLISRAEFLSFYEAYLSDERRQTAAQADGGNFYAVQSRRVGRRFAETVVHAVRGGKLPYSEAYRLTGLYGHVFEQYAQSIGVRS